MSMRGKIKAFVSLVSAAMLLAAATGITVVSHSCLHSGKVTYEAGFIAGNDTDAESCCTIEQPCTGNCQPGDATDDNVPDHHREAGSLSDCCSYSSFILKVNNFVPEVTKLITPDFVITPITLSPVKTPLNKAYNITPFCNLEKYGGIPLVKLYHQFII